jgi:signal peptide peptidase SppA
MPLLRRLMPQSWREKHPIIPVIKLAGTIGSSNGPLRSGLNLQGCSSALDKAFGIESEAVVIIVNSPGGSPVQSKLIHDRIRDLAEQKDREVIVFIEDVGASGGYMIACAGDKIFADPSSIIGSIGVISAGFGFVDLIEKIGVERRVYTAGKRKLMLDPFQPQKEDDVEHLKALQQDVHEAFVDLVKASRGDRLNGEDDSLFSGAFWSGEKAKELGLVDDMQSLRPYLRDRFGDKARGILIDTEKAPFLKRLMGGSTSSLISAQDWLDTLEDRSVWARFGL